jgi:hypothetical protein
MTIEARRHSPRVRLGEAAYINFASGNRGVILDVSEGGLRFKASSPLAAPESLRFWLTEGQRSEATADLVWTSSSGTIGGLHFTSIPPELSSRIRSWIDRGETTAAAAEPSLDGWIEEPPTIALSAGAPLLAHEAENASGLATGESQVARHPAGASAGLAAAGQAGRSQRSSLIENEHRLSMFPSEAQPTGEYPSSQSGRSSQNRAAVAVLVVLLLIGAGVGFLSYRYPDQTRNAMARIQDKVSQWVNIPRRQGVSNAEHAGIGESQPNLESAPPAPDVTAPSWSAGKPSPQVQSSESSNEKSAAGSASSQTPDTDRSASPAPLANSEPAQSRNNSDADMALAQTYLQKGSDATQQSKAVQLLWLATEKGNVDAEIQLADLYIQGVAVQKSCVQARILLKAAATANPGAAQQKLDDLDKSGCS